MIAIDMGRNALAGIRCFQRPRVAAGGGRAPTESRNALAGIRCFQRIHQPA